MIEGSPLITDEAAAKAYLQGAGIELGMDPRSPLEIANLYLTTGSTAMRDPVEITEVGPTAPYVDL